ncbi:MAG: diacylglycerol kinase family lipid kinase [Acidobacteria bacterium]|nr:diacylglycerol kinase family lipid kinase [Acidobacteriota bacterium]
MAERQATIIYNPMSGRKGKRAEQAAQMVRLLAAHGIKADAQATHAPDDATRLTREALANGANLIISYGGDGTLNEVIQAMVGSDAVLGVWAGGTANVVARDLELPRQPQPLAAVIAAGKTKRIALGVASRSLESVVWRPVSDEQINTSATVPETRKTAKQAEPVNVGRQTPDARHQTRRYFFMFAGIGLDASIARGVNRKLKRRMGEFAFWVSGLRHLLLWQRQRFTVAVDGQRYDSAFTLIGKGKSYGGNLVIAKNARLEDPEFEVFILPRFKTTFAYLFALIKCFFKRPEKTQAVIVKSHRVTLDSDEEVWVELDGEVVGTLPMTFEVLPDALSVIVP